MSTELNKETVFIKDKLRTEGIIKNLVNGSSDRLQVVSDFDMTLTKFKDRDDSLCDSTYRALELSPLLPEDYRAAVAQLKEFYYAIEIDPVMTIEEKVPHMVDWYTKSHDHLIKNQMQREWIAQMVKDSRIVFRDGCNWLFQQLHKCQVPLLIFSAGIGDILIEALQRRAVYCDNMKVVSNFMDFDDKGLLVGFKGELLHVFNKNENAVHNSSYFSDLSHRDNIILMGDSIGDLRMADGAAKCSNVLRIGFLNDKIDERLQTYLDAFDIVLVNDQTMDVPNAIVKRITSNNHL